MNIISTKHTPAPLKRGKLHIRHYKYQHQKDIVRHTSPLERG